MLNPTLFSAAAALAIALMSANSASAHNYMTTLRAPANYMFDMEARVAHGCLSEDVIEVRLKIPEGVFRVTPANTRDWEVVTEMREVDPPVPGDGGRPITRTVDTIIWKNLTKELPFDRQEGFKFRAKLPNEPGRVLFWQMVNICAESRDPYTDLPEQAFDVKDPNFAKQFEEFMGSTAHPAPYTVLYQADMPQYPWEWSAENMQTTGITPAEQTAEAKD